MFSRTNVTRFVLGLMIFTMLFTACETTPKASTAKSLDEWKGEWVSMGEATKSPELNATFKEVAKTTPNYTAGGLREALIGMYDVSVVKIAFTENNMAKMTVVETDRKTKKTTTSEISMQYKYMGQLPMKGFKHKWEAFKAVKPNRKVRAANYIIMTPAHSHDGGNKHWHARFGGVNFESLVDMSDDYWPTFVSSSIPQSDLISSLKKNMAGTVKYFGVPFKGDFSKYGKWLSVGHLIKDKSPEVEAVFNKIIKKYAGKNPKGGDFTRSDLEQIVQKAMGDDSTFTHIEFVVGKGKDKTNKIVIWKGNSKVFEAPYKRDVNPKKQGSFSVITDSRKAGDFTAITMTSPHGMPLHVHMWYGKNFDAVNSLELKPTAIPANSSVKDKANFVERLLDKKFLPKIVK